MKGGRLAKQIVRWILPAGVQAAIERQRACRASNPCAAMEAVFARNKKFHSIHQGKRCFVLGSGPSINKQNLKPLRNEICFAGSHFLLHKDIKVIDPLYHVDAPIHPPFYDGFDALRKLSFERFDKSYSERTIYFFGHSPYEYSVYNFLKQNSQFKKENAYYLDYCRSPQLDESNYNNPDLWDICRPLFQPRSVIYCAIQVAAYMGFEKIYLLGCDHDYLLHVTRGRSLHFYEDEEGLDDSAGWPSTEEFFLAYYLRWKQYRLMRSWLEPHGCYIYDATEGGLLDVFPKVSLYKVLKQHD
jgi:hypothetical protein